MLWHVRAGRVEEILDLADADDLPHAPLELLDERRIRDLPAEHDSPGLDVEVDRALRERRVAEDLAAHLRERRKDWSDETLADSAREAVARREAGGEVGNDDAFQAAGELRSLYGTLLDAPQAEAGADLRDPNGDLGGMR